jgi:hypothetical protein
MLQNRLECQLRTPCDPRTAREWAHCIVRHTPNKPPEQIAADARIPLKRLMKISAPQGETCARIEEIAAVTRATARFEWLRFHVRDAGCELFALPTCDGGLDSEVLDQITASLRSLTAMVDGLREITRDRRIDDAERAAFDDLYGRHLACAARLQAWVHERSREDAAVADRRRPLESRLGGIRVQRS